MIDEQTYRSFLYDLSSGMKNWQSTTLITGEVMPDSIHSDIVAYISDGIMMIYNDDEAGKRRRYLEVLKMRGTAHTTGKQMLEIGTDGITVYPYE